jgi:glyoxylase-like metal-dependent hydrolase (beta-lactamase superfamily II)
MKKIFLLAVVTLILAVTSLNAQVFKNKDLSITKIEDQLWVVETTDMTAMYIIEGKDKALLVDTGTRCADLDKVVSQITKKPLYVVLTHMHGDHAGNIKYFKEIYYHKDDDVLVKNMPKYNGKVNYIKDGDVFDLGGKKLEVLHMPAHTPGSIVLLDRQAGNCYSGDSFGSGEAWLQLQPIMPIKTYVNSLKRMETIMKNDGITKVYCGHYPYMKKAYKKDYIDDMLTLAESLDAGKPIDAKKYTKNNPERWNKPMVVTKNEANIVYDADHLK